MIDCQHETVLAFLGIVVDAERQHNRIQAELDALPYQCELALRMLNELPAIELPVILGMDVDELLSRLRCHLSTLKPPVSPAAHTLAG